MSGNELPMKKKDKPFLDPNWESAEDLNLFAFALDQLETMAGILDPDGNILFANRSALKLVGVTWEEVQGMNFNDSPWRKNTKGGVPLSDSLMKAAQEGKRAVVEDIAYTIDGSEVPVLFSISLPTAVTAITGTP